MTADIYAACYTAGRDWAEDEAAACGDGPLPEWTPPFRTALAIGQSTEGAEVVLKAARESWAVLRKFGGT